MPAATAQVPASMRSGTVCQVTPESSSTPVTRSVDVPMPSISAPMANSIRQRSWTSGSRAALSITVTPSASTAAISRFSVAPDAGELER